MISKDDIIKAKQKKKKVWSSPKVKLLTFVKLYLFIWPCWLGLGWGTGCPWRPAASFPVVHGLSGCGLWASLLHGMWDLSSPARDQICIPCIAGWVFNCWTTELCKLTPSAHEASHAASLFFHCAICWWKLSYGLMFGAPSLGLFWSVLVMMLQGLCVCVCV